jgi:ubiquinol-cytochrome c reductase iron-sulfur subunit
VNRRLVLLRIVQAFSLTAFTALAYPFFRNWFPSETRMLSRNVPIGGMAPGEAKYVDWLGRRVVVLRRTPDQIARLEQPTGRPDGEAAGADVQLKDPGSNESIQPESMRNIYRSLRPEVFVAFASCTHLGCEVSVGREDPAVAFSCPCHQSEFDAAGRVQRESAAPTNLEVPAHQFISGNELRLWRPT